MGRRSPIGRFALLTVSVITALVLPGPWAAASAARPVILYATLTPATWNRGASGTGSGTAVVEINAERTRMSYRITYEGVSTDIVEVMFCAGVGTTLSPGASIPADAPNYCEILASTWKGGPSPIVGSGPINYTKEVAPDPQSVPALVSGTAYMRLMSKNGPELEGRLGRAAPQTDADPGPSAAPSDRWSVLIPVLAGVLAFLVVIGRRGRRDAAVGRR
jgi:hypothetical protein